MKLQFRQGLVRYQTSVGGVPAFLALDNSGSYINLVVAPDPTIITFAHGAANYLFEEARSVDRAWGPMIPGQSAWLYWDIDVNTAARSFGFTLRAPITSPTAPPSPVLDQHWFDKLNNKMKVFNGTAWIERIRVFAATYDGGSSIQPYPVGTQVGINSFPNEAGFIMFDVDELPARKVLPGGKFNFLTTASKFITHASRSVTLSMETLHYPLQADETIPQYHLVCLTEGRKIAVAKYTDIQRPAVGLAVEAIDRDEIRGFVQSGYVTNQLWNWNDTPGTPLFVGEFGELSKDVPQVTSIQQIGHIVDNTTIFVNIGPQIILLDTLGA